MSAIRFSVAAIVDAHRRVRLGVSTDRRPHGYIEGTVAAVGFQPEAGEAARCRCPCRDQGDVLVVEDGAGLVYIERSKTD